MDSAPQTALHGVSSPAEVFGPLFASLDMTTIISIAAFILFFIWALYTTVASYHLLRYGHRSAVAVPAIITHVLVSFSLALFAVSGLHL
jgi:hypothetical protein